MRVAKRDGGDDAMDAMGALTELTGAGCLKGCVEVKCNLGMGWQANISEREIVIIMSQRTTREWTAT